MRIPIEIETKISKLITYSLAILWYKESIDIIYGPSHLIRHPSKIPLKASFSNHFIGIRYSYPQSGTLKIMIVSAPSEDKGTYFMPKMRLLKGALKGPLKGILSNDSGL